MAENKFEEEKRMKELSPKTYPVGVGILTALFLTNFVEEKWVAILAIFLIFGVYAIDLARFLMAPEQKQEKKGTKSRDYIEGSDNNYWPR